MIPTDVITRALPRLPGAASWPAPSPAALDPEPTAALAPAPAQTAAASVAGRWLLVLTRVFWLQLGIGLVLAVVAAARGIVVQGDWMYSDGVLLYHILRARDGLPLYVDFSTPPFLALVYWPLYFEVAGLIARVADLGVEGTLYAARLLSVAGAIVAAGSIGGLTWASGGGWRASVAGGGLFLTAYVVHPWAYSVRADLPALGLVLLGLFIVLGSRGPAGAVLGGLCLAAGFTTKQTYVVAVTSATLVLLWRREWLRALLVAGTWVATVGGTVLYLQVSSGGLFFVNTVSSNLLPLRLETMLDHVRTFGPLSLPLLALAAIGVRGARSRPGSVWPRILYAVLATSVGLVTIARAGSYYNHLLEATAALAVLAGLGFDRCLVALKELAAGARGARRESLVALAALLVAVAGSGLPLLALAYKAADPPDRSALIQALRDAPGPVLTEKDALAVVLAGKEPIGGDPLGVGLLAAAGQWDPAPLDALIGERSFGLIALNHPVDERAAFDEFAWWPAGTRELIAASYRPSGRLGDLYLYVPDGQASSGSAAASGAAPTEPAAGGADAAR